MAKGQNEKEEIYAKLKEIYPAMFADGKIMRIPFSVDGETIEIKVTLTAAKDVLGGGASADLSKTKVENRVEVPLTAEPTAQERKNVEALLKSLNL